MRRVFPFAALVVLAGVALSTRAFWGAWLWPAPVVGRNALDRPPVESQTVELSEQAQRNLGLVSREVRLETFWKKLTVPGSVIDRPGLSDRGVTAPVAGVISQVHALPGDTVRPGDRLFTLRLVSEYAQNAQSELFKTVRELASAREQLQRATSAGSALPEARLTEVRNQVRRLETSQQAYRHDLLARGLTAEQIDAVQQGKFVTHVVVTAPEQHPDHPSLVSLPGPAEAAGRAPVGYEVQELKADLGQQVQAGQVLACLANHQLLSLEGRAFRQELPAIERAARKGWPVEVEFVGVRPDGWPDRPQTVRIRSLGNSIDPHSRTVPFYLPLENQSRGYERDGRTFLTWRYRPGQRIHLHIPVERLDGVIVLPAAAVVREGPEAFVFRASGDTFDRKPVQILHEDRRHVVIAPGNIAPGVFVAHSGAAVLNRVLRAQNASGTDAGGHWHADGTFHRH